MGSCLRGSLVLLAVLALLAGAGCGGDDEDGGAPSPGAGTATEETVETVPTDTTRTDTTETDGAAPDGGGAEAPPADSPEQQEGGAGDEVPASSQALIVGDGGRLHPRTVRVPPFIAIRVVLRSADGVEYELSGGGGSVRAGGEIESAATTFEGLRTGERLILSGPQGRVAIVADAEPGP